jgi:putative ribosome biogenesis GTPase RsgA
MKKPYRYLAVTRNLGLCQSERSLALIEHKKWRPLLILNRYDLAKVHNTNFSLT